MADAPSQPNAWFLRKESGDTFGPAELASLCEWSRDGRIAPEDLVSTDGEEWRPAFELAPLDMVWTMALPDGGTYGPAHRSVFADMLEDGTADPPLRLRHKATGKELILGGQPAAEPVRRPRDTQPIAAEAEAAPKRSTPQTAPSQPTTQPAARDFIVADLERAVGDARRWKELYDRESLALRETAARLTEATERSARDKAATATELEALRSERGAGRSALTAADAEIQRLRRDLDAARAEADSLRAELDTARQDLHTAGADLESGRTDLAAAKANLEATRSDLDAAVARPVTGSGGAETPADVAEVYRDLMDNYDRLVARFEDKTEDLNRARAEADAVRTESKERVKVAEDHAARELQSAEAARRRLQELETSYADIVKSYRDLNDRFIRMREQQTTGRAPAPARPAADGKPAPASAPPEPETRSRIRLRR